MTDCIMVACDLHDKTMLLKIARGREAPQTCSVANTLQERRKLLSMLKKRSEAADGARVIFAYEASCQGFGLYDELTEADFECCVLAPTRIARSVQHLVVRRGFARYYARQRGRVCGTILRRKRPTSGSLLATRNTRRLR